MSNFASLTRTRIQLALRNKMFFFFSAVFPLGMFFLYAGIFARGNPRAVSYFLGPVIAFNVMGSFWGLSAALVMFREQGISHHFHRALSCARRLSCSKYRRCSFSRGSRHCRHAFFRLARSGRRQRHQYHAGNPGPQPTHLASSDFPFWRHLPARIFTQLRPALWPLPAGHLSCYCPSERPVRIVSRLETLGTNPCPRFVGHPYVFCVVATLSLGA